MPNINPVTILLLIVFSYPIIKGFLLKFCSKNLKFDIEEINKNISFIIAIFLGIYYGKKLFLQHDVGIYKTIYDMIPKNIILYIESRSFIIYILLIPLFILIIYKIISTILHCLNKITVYLILDRIEKFLKGKSNFFRSVIGALFQIPKSIAYVLLVSLLFNIASMFYTNKIFNNYLGQSKSYNYICKKFIIPVTNSKIARKLPGIINNSFKIVVKEPGNNNKNIKKTIRSNAIVYYNGVTLSEGIKSNNDIDEFSRLLTKDKSTTKKKAKTIYNWIGSNIDYDYAKAYEILNDKFDVRSGAINTFNTKRGICFDYACLCIAMCRANNINVRLVTGQGFNGVSWISHAWNQIYIPEEHKWINVDTTFYKGGNYFNSNRFNIDHKDATIVGEW